MAFSPCAFHGGKYAGGANSFFLRLVRGGEQRGGKIQVCANCAALALEYLALHTVKVSEGEVFLEWTRPVLCGNCGSEYGSDHWTLYANTYARGMVETQRFGLFCANCAYAVVEDLHLDQAESRR